MLLDLPKGPVLDRPTCGRLYLLLNHALYRHNARYSGISALEWATRHGFETTARKSLAAGVPHGACCHTKWKPIEVAVQHGHEAMVRLFLDWGIDPNTPDFSPLSQEDAGLLRLAASKGQENIIRLLQRAAKIGEEVVRSLLEHNIHVQLLLEKGADPLSENFGRESPLEAAARDDEVEWIKLLLEAIDKREIPLEDLQPKLARAQFQAAENDCLKTKRLLERFY
ncbi:hypothetical protein NUU61_006172 [Penicillium alfredii]|uniref:Ankyrin n=1 Tax=Penicillium alfredii TaxID=1506179 RepID=A0A9W9F0G5_9EURO|nr:uncharacterized protein NUU61_006172 [Penicillium alfredii]KAJ5091302.1 hypothetical protein NUU61_006172 [Penicillium alfredii]